MQTIHPQNRFLSSRFYMFLDMIHLFNYSWSFWILVSCLNHFVANRQVGLPGKNSKSSAAPIMENFLQPTFLPCCLLLLNPLYFTKSNFQSMVDAPRSTEPYHTTYMQGCLVPVHIVGNVMSWLDTKIHCVGILFSPHCSTCVQFSYFALNIGISYSTS